MPRTGEKRTEAQKKADKRYNEKVKEYKRETFATVGAMLKKEEADAIRATFTGAGIKTADAIRAAAHYLQNGGTIAAGQKPITPTESAPTVDESPDGNTDGANG